jgi:hypothetical protein
LSRFRILHKVKHSAENDHAVITTRETRTSARVHKTMLPPYTMRLHPFMLFLTSPLALPSHKTSSQTFITRESRASSIIALYLCRSHNASTTCLRTHTLLPRVVSTSTNGPFKSNHLGRVKAELSIAWYASTQEGCDTSATKLPIRYTSNCINLGTLASSPQKWLPVCQHYSDSSYVHEHRS